jgi:beta-aspartyl-peptidase (threonine type)
LATLIVHGGAGPTPEERRPEHQAAAERALEAGWAVLPQGALAAVVAAVRHLEDEPTLNAGVGAARNRDGEFELDAGVMEGTTLRAGAVGAVRDVRHPVDVARAVMDDGTHVLLVAAGASAFARERGLELCEPSAFVAPGAAPPSSLRGGYPGPRFGESEDTVGAAAMDSAGRLAVAVSTGGKRGKLPGRLGDSPIPGAGFYADDSRGAACGTGLGEAFMRLSLCHLAVVEMGSGRPAEDVARSAVDCLARRTGATGGLILIDRHGRPGAAYNTPFMAWAVRSTP